MYTPCTLCRKDAARRNPLNGEGLGDDEYTGTNKAGEILQKVGPILHPFESAIIGIVPKKILKSIGIDLNPVSMVLAPFTFGLTLLPGVSQLIGSVFGGLFSKATHMGDCMKWWSDENIKGMVKNIEPYPFSFEAYMMESFPQFLRQYQTLQAGGQWAEAGVESLVSIPNRKRKVISEFIRLVRANPDLMTLQCAVRERAETGYTGHTQAQVDVYWEGAKEAAKQKEYQATIKLVDAIVSKWKVKETWGEIVKSRDAGLIAKEKGAGFDLKTPDNVIGVKRGAFVMTLKGGQTSAKPVTFGK